MPKPAWAATWSTERSVASSSRARVLDPLLGEPLAGRHAHFLTEARQKVRTLIRACSAGSASGSGRWSRSRARPRVGAVVASWGSCIGRSMYWAWPSSTNSTFASTWTRGKVRWNWSASFQWVVVRRASSRPAAAST
ncbi:hypothetical protein ACWDYJ_11890 [Streptomyces sp. NPDC003042]